MTLIAKGLTWEHYFKQRAFNGKPSLWLEWAVQKMGDVRGNALDACAGPLVDTGYLLKQGFDVTAVEQNPVDLEYQLALPPGPLSLVTLDIRKFNFPAQQFNLVSVQQALGFIPPKDFNQVFEGMVSSLRPKGFLCGQFFGENDVRASNPQTTKGSFHTEAEVKEICETRKLKIIDFKNDDANRIASDGVKRRLHYYHVIAQKL